MATSLSPMGPVTKWLCIGTVAASALFAFTQRQFGFGSGDLIFTVDGALRLELWRLVTFPFIERDPISLIIGVIVLYFFGRFFEAKWGSRDYLRFFLVSSFGAAVLAIPLGFVIDIVMPFVDTKGAAGPDPALDAMLVAMALIMPDSNVLFGFVLPIRARTLVYVFLGFQVITGIMTGAAALGITLGGMAMGYVLVTGNWRPDRLINRLHLWRLGRKRKNRGLYVVPPRDDDPTLH